MTLPARIGRYRVLGVLGQGAMGVVYRCRDEALDRDVAVKVMSGGLSDREGCERFEREAKAAARLQHPNIITIYELGEHEGNPFMALELLEGVDLQRAIEAGVRPDPKITLPIVLQLVAGLGHAHDHGIVHRDVKPSNVFLPRGRPAKIMDFGVARLGAGMTTAGMVVGTPNYMSPEQVRGATLDGRSDLFSAGLILYELVTGEKAYKGDTVVALMYKIAHDDPDLALLPRGAAWERLRGVMARSLARDPQERYSDASSMIAGLESALRDLGGHANWAVAADAGLLVRTGPRPVVLEAPSGVEALAAGPEAGPPRVPTGLAAGVGALAVALLAGGGYLAFRSGSETPAAPSATPSPAARGAASPSVTPPAASTRRADERSSLAFDLPTAPPASPSPVPRNTPAPPASPQPTPRPSPAAPTPAAPTVPTPTPAAPEADPATATLDRAESLFAQGRYAAAMREAKAILARERNNTQAQHLVEDAEVEIVVEGKIREAREALQRGDKDAAQQAAKAGLIVKPTDSRLLDLWRQATQ